MRKILIIITVLSILLTGCATNNSDVVTDISVVPSDKIETIDDKKTEIFGVDYIASAEEVISNNLSGSKIIEEDFEEFEKTEDVETTLETKNISIIDEPENLEEQITKDYEITDIVLGGRDVTTYGEFKDDFVVSLESVLDGYNKNISLAVYSLDGSKAIVYNGNQEYFSACTVKIPWMIYLCREIDAGRVDKDTIITYEEKHYHKGSGTIRKGSYGDQYTVEQLINLCLSISDNVAYEMLVQEVIDRNDFYKYIESLNMDRFSIPSYSIWCSNAIPTDFLIIWKDVYEYFKTETTGSKILKTACTNTIWNYGTATLQNYGYSHKSGDNWEPNAAHNDAGIVWSDNPYVYAVFTKSEGNDYDERTIDAVMGLIHEEFCK